MNLELQYAGVAHIPEHSLIKREDREGTVLTRLGLSRQLQFGCEASTLRNHGSPGLRNSGGVLLDSGPAVQVEALLRVDHPTHKDVRFPAVVVQTTADKFGSKDRISIAVAFVRRFMMRKNKGLLLGLALAMLMASCPLSLLHAQNFTTVTAANVSNISGNKLVRGSMCFTATDANDIPLNFQIGGGGQASNRSSCTPVLNGAIGTFSVANPAQTVPLNINYRIQVSDPNGIVITYKNVQFFGATFNFDAYVPPVGSIAVGVSVPFLDVGSLNISGGCTGCSGFIQLYYPTGTKNGSNLVFTLVPQQSASSTPAIYLNGVLLDSTSDYSLSGITLTMASGLAPLLGDSLIAYYSTGAPPSPSLHTPSGAKNGVNLVFTIASPPPPSNYLAVLIEENGQLLDPATDYTLVGTTLTLSVPAPISSDSLVAYY